MRTATRPLTRRLREHCGQGACRVDRERGVIHGVKVLGTESVNGVEGMAGVRRRVYPAGVLREAARLYEGAKVDWNHQPGKGHHPRDASDGVGELRNVRATREGLFADLHYLTSHPRAGTLVEAAERMPRRYGLSPHHSVEGRQRGAAFVVTKIVEVHSVDVVHSPATTRGLFEGKAMSTRRGSAYEDGSDELRGKNQDAQLRAMMAKDPEGAPRTGEKSRHSGKRIGGRYEGEDMPAGDDDLGLGGDMAPAAPEAPATPAPGEGYKMEAMALIDAIFSGDPEALKKLNELARLAQKHMGGAEKDSGDAEEDEDEDEGDDDRDRKEHRERPARPRRPAFDASGVALRLLAEHRVAPTPLVVKALAACQNELEMREVLADYRSQSRVGPRSAERGRGNRTADMAPDNGADFAKWIRN